MIRVIASGDHHFCASSARWSECLRIHNWIAELVEREQPDAFLSAGDLFDRRTTPEERNAVARFLQRIADVCPVVVARGNHDEDLSLLGELSSPHPIIIEQAARVHAIEARDTSTIAIAAVAWPRRAQLASRAPEGASIDVAAAEALRAVFRGIGDELERFNCPRILVGHFMIDGAVLSNGNPLVGSDMNVGIADLALARADATVCGHIHRADAWEFMGQPILYTGSPFRTTYGELEEKSVTLLEFDGPHKVHVSRIRTPCAPMLHIEGEYVGTDGAAFVSDIVFRDPPPADVRGAELRLRYLVASDERESAKRAAVEWQTRWLAAGAVDVKLEEEVAASTRARAPEVASAPTIEEQLAAMWRQRGVEAERQQRMRAQLACVVEEVRDAA